MGFGDLGATNVAVVEEDEGVVGVLRCYDRDAHG
jgi:hypothetical protein